MLASKDCQSKFLPRLAKLHGLLLSLYRALFIKATLILRLQQFDHYLIGQDSQSINLFDREIMISFDFNRYPTRYPYFADLNVEHFYPKGKKILDSASKGESGQNKIPLRRKNIANLALWLIRGQ